jgi:hypothetical protein
VATQLQLTNISYQNTNKRNFISQTRLNKLAVLAFVQKKAAKMEAKERTSNFLIEKSRRTVSKSRARFFDRFRYFEN